MNDTLSTRLVKNVSFFIFDILEGIIDVVAMRDKGNQAYEHVIPPTMTRELVKFRGLMSTSLLVS